jgi:formimidoylglutamate deiminase
VRRVFAPELLYTNGSFERRQAVECVDGLIVGTVAAADEPDAIVLRGKALLPGLVNAHSHAFQRVFRGQTEQRRNRRDDFWSWREAMYRAAERLSVEDVYRVARMAFLEMALSGISTVGEFHYLHGDVPNQIDLQMVRAARSVGIRICLLRVAYARAGFRGEPHPAQKRFVEAADQFLRNVEALRDVVNDDYAWVGVAPHSIRAVPLDYLHEVAEWAAHHQAPIHMHVSEQPRELAESREEYGLTPVLLLARERILSPHFTAVHGIHLLPEEVCALADANATVCACPTTERNLGDGIVPAAVLRNQGVRIALGSDSQAQINILEDARELEYHLRLTNLERGILDPIDLLRAATEWGAASLHVPKHAADFFTVDLRDPSIAGAPVEALAAGIVFSASRSAIRDLIVGGEFVVRDGRHSLSTEIVDEFLRVPQ